MHEKKFKPLRIDDTLAGADLGVALAAMLEEAYFALRDAPGCDRASIQTWPQGLLEEHRTSRRTSRLGAILRTACDVRDGVDRVVFLGASAAMQPAADLLVACREPYFNEWTRAERGGRPRIHFLPTTLDNDLAAMTASLLARERSPDAFGGRWAIVGLVPSERDRAFDALWDLMTIQLGADVCLRQATSADKSESPFSTFSLLAGSIMGIDVVRLLEGAVAMQRRFEDEPPAINAAVRLARSLRTYAALGRRDERLQLAVWSQALAQMKWWRSQLSRPLGERPIDVVAFPAVDGEKRTPALSIAVDHWRCDSIADLPLVASERLEAWLDGRRVAGSPTIEVRLPAVDEASLGQFFQFLLLAGELCRPPL